MGKKTNFLLDAHEVEIALSTVAFSVSHIGMSAIRTDLIHGIGMTAQNLGLVDKGYTLPDFWPGDEAGQEVFPTAEIAGRQLYRILYTIVSFATLGYGFIAYVNSISCEDTINAMTISNTNNQITIFYYGLASLSWGISIASLINPSPLSLVPIYEQANENDATTREMTTLRRNDSRKLQAYGLTRITRHPLILPVVPWGFTTAIIMGGQLRDFLFFGVLSMYAIAGCAAQDLRVLREEGSVGTVFNPDDSLQQFFGETSFFPFQAMLESRQSASDVIKETPWWALVIGTVIGYQAQQELVQFLLSYSSKQ